jgi:hypothetical protein
MQQWALRGRMCRRPGEECIEPAWKSQRKSEASIYPRSLPLLSEILFGEEAWKAPLTLVRPRDIAVINRDWTNDRAFRQALVTSEFYWTALGRTIIRLDGVRLVYLQMRVRFKCGIPGHPLSDGGPLLGNPRCLAYVARRHIH